LRRGGSAATPQIVAGEVQSAASTIWAVAEEARISPLHSLFLREGASGAAFALFVQTP